MKLEVVLEQENVRLCSHLLEHIKLYFMYNKKKMEDTWYIVSH